MKENKFVLGGAEQFLTFRTRPAQPAGIDSIAPRCVLLDHHLFAGPLELTQCEIVSKYN